MSSIYRIIKRSTRLSDKSPTFSPRRCQNPTKSRPTPTRSRAASHHRQLRSITALPRDPLNAKLSILSIRLYKAAFRLLPHTNKTLRPPSHENVMPDMPIHEITPTRNETTTPSSIVAGSEAINRESDLHGPQLENECRTTTITIRLIASPRLDMLFPNRNPNETA